MVSRYPKYYYLRQFANCQVGAIDVKHDSSILRFQRRDDKKEIGMLLSQTRLPTRPKWATELWEAFIASDITLILMSSGIPFFICD